MSAFEFATAGRVIFGAGKLNGLADQLKGSVKRLLLVRGNSSDAIPRVREILSGQGILFDEFSVHGEPTVDTVSEGVGLALQHGCDMVVGLGGGSVLDAGKAVSALATNRGDIFDYLEVIGRGKPLSNAPLPYIAIPTTAGTGTEVTRNAVIESPA
ncbi:MAG: iron-containing alcohol dehydrogenase, partial [Anaerolineales bacterium]|nr:iron-containing alcohol dehydrogenase [Anaerolineales bacterium]